MKLTIGKIEFEKNLASVFGATGDGKNLAILSHILLTIKGDTATMSATDLSIELTSTFPILNGEDGTIAFPAKKVQEITKELPSGEVHISTSGNGFTITAGKSRFNLTGMEPDTFPTLKSPKTEIVSFGADALSLFLNQTRHAICADEEKYNLAGTYIHVKDGKLNFVATNGHRLAISSREKELPEGFLPKKGVIVPRKGVVEICKMADIHKGGGKVAMAHYNGTLFVLTEESRLAVRLVDGDFPDYNKVIPTSEGTSVLINKQALNQALKRVSLMSENTTANKGRARLVFSNGLLNISASNSNSGEATEEVEVAYTGDPQEVNLNSRYVMDALAALEKEEEVKMTLRGDGKPVTITNLKEHFLSIIMPMRA